MDYSAVSLLLLKPGTMTELFVHFIHTSARTSTYFYYSSPAPNPLFSVLTGRLQPYSSLPP